MSSHPTTIDPKHQPSAERTSKPASKLNNSANRKPQLFKNHQTSPVEPPSSPGPVSAVVYFTPVLADNPGHSLVTGRGTDKGETSYTPKDNAEIVAIATTEAHQETQERTVGAPKVHKPSSTHSITYDSLVAERTPRTTLPELARSNAAIYDLLQLNQQNIPSPTAGTSCLTASSKRNLRGKPPVKVTTQSTPVRQSQPTTVRHSQNASTKTVLAIQWNMNGYYNNLADLEILVRDQEPLVLAIQEPHKISINSLNHSLRRQYTWSLKCNQNFYHSTACLYLTRHFNSTPTSL